MSADTITLHGVAVAAGEHGILIRGAPGSGKSTLAAQMIATWTRPPVRLVADDRVRLTRAGGRLVARGHPQITGKLEMRGLGIVSQELLDAVVLRLIVDLIEERPPRLPDPSDLHVVILGERLPRLRLDSSAEPLGRLHMMWSHICNDLMSL